MGKTWAEIARRFYEPHRIKPRIFVTNEPCIRMAAGQHDPTRSGMIGTLEDRAWAGPPTALSHVHVQRVRPRFRRSIAARPAASARHYRRCRGREHLLQPAAA